MFNVLCLFVDMFLMLSFIVCIKEMEMLGVFKEGVDLENVIKCLKMYNID